MKVKPTFFNTKTILFSVLLAGGMALAPLSGHAQDNLSGNSSDDAAFTCASAINVMDCIKQTQDPSVKQSDPSNLKSAASFSNQTFGLTGPVTFNVRYDSDLSWILDAGYAQKLGDRAAAALKVSAGLNEYRGNGTLGFNITPKQQIKITYEYLTQNLPFDYTSGTINQWVSQNAYGAAYRYLVSNNSILQAVELSGSYTQANSKDLSEVWMYDGSGNVDQIVERRIAGGQKKDGLVSAILTPFKRTLIKIGAGYSSSSFDTQWVDNQANSTIAYDVEASQLITPKTMVSASVNNDSTNSAQTVKISQILPGHLEGNISGQYNVSHVDGIASNANVSAGISYPAPKTYSNMFSSSNIGDLKSWVEQPVIYNNRVLAIADEKVLKVKIDTKTISTQTIPVNFNAQDAVQINTQDYFTFDKQVYDRVDYSIVTYLKNTNLSSSAQPTPVDLKLQMSTVDSYNATLTSAPMPANALIQDGSGNPTAYTTTITATGYRNGTPIIKTDNTFELDVAVNPAAPAAQWKDNTLPTAPIESNTYNSGPLASHIVPAVPGEQFTFAVQKPGSDKPADASTWLDLATDQQSLGVKSGQTTPSAPTQDTITIIATSLVSNKSVVVSQTGQEAQKFNIAVSGEVTLPNWSNPSKPLPDAAKGVGYTIDLNPYDATYPEKYLTQTSVKAADGSTKKVSDDLTYEVRNAAGDCPTGWLAISGSKFTVANIADTTCNATIRITSQLAAPGQYVDRTATITMKDPTYIASTWTGKEFDSYKSGDNISVDLNPYPYNHQTKDMQYLNYTYNQDANTDATEDVFSNFNLVNKSCTNTNDTSWLKIDNTTGLLTGTVPASLVTGTCSFSINFDSKVTGHVDLKNTLKSFDINSTAPVWNTSSPALQSIKYLPNTQYPSAIPGINLSGNVNTQGGGNPYLADVTYAYQKGINLPSGGIPDPNNNPIWITDPSTYMTYLKLNPTADDIVGDQYPSTDTTNFVGTIIAQAYKNGSAPSGNATFMVRYYAPLTNPTLQTSSFPVAPLNQDYAVVIDPYKSSNTYLSKTKYTTEDGVSGYLNNDTLTIHSDSTCWASVDSTTGKIVGKPTDANPLPCTFNVTVNSARNLGGSSSTFPITINTEGSAAGWDITKTSGNINFDDTTGTNVNLNNMVTQDTLATPNLDFNFADADSSNSKISKDGHWKISNASGKFYLQRNTYQANGATTIDATDIGTKIVNIIASNAKSDPNQPAVGNVTMTVKANSANVMFYWAGDKKPKFIGQATDQTIDLNANVKTKLRDGSAVINDSITMNYSMTPASNSTATTTPGGSIWVYSADGSNFSLKIPASVVSDPRSYGVYPNSLSGDSSSHIYLYNLYSKAANTTTATYDISSSTTDINNINLIIGGTLTWSGSDFGANSIKFDAIKDPKVNGGTKDVDYINLNEKLSSDPALANFSGFGLTFADSGTTTSADGKWKISNSNNNWYLFKAVTGNTISAANVNLTEAVPNIIASDLNDGMNDSAPQGGNPKILPDEKVVINWYIPGPNGGPSDNFYILPGDDTGGNKTYMFAKDKNVGNGVNGYLRPCLPGDNSCQIEITEDTIYWSSNFQGNDHDNNISGCTGGSGGNIDGQTIFYFNGGSFYNEPQNTFFLYVGQSAISSGSFGNNCGTSDPQIHIKPQYGIYSKSQGPNATPLSKDLHIKKCTSGDVNSLPGCSAY